MGAFMKLKHSHGLSVVVHAVSCLLFAAGLPAQQARPAAPAPDPAAAQRMAENNRRADEPGSGPYAAMKEEIAALPRHVVYRPANLAAMGPRKLGLMAWGNGGCSDDGASSRFHLLEIASHGYLVIAAGRILSGPGAPPREVRPPPPAGQLPPPRTQASDLSDAITWALAENQRSGSPYFGRIDPKQVAVSGFSCGGLQALRVTGDPRISAVVLQNTGVFIEGPSSIPGMDVGKDVLKTIHTPVLYILGGPTDIAYKNGMDDFQKIEKFPVAVANLPVGHGGTYDQRNGGAAATVATDWLAWQLRGDEAAALRFIGKDCGLCKDTQWTLQWRNQPAAGN
jgi:dienelactone hydrolase